MSLGNIRQSFAHTFIINSPNANVGSVQGGNGGSLVQDCLHTLLKFGTKSEEDLNKLNQTDRFRPELCDWIVSDPVFVSWWHKRLVGPTLWLCGGPGKGKTRLVMRVIRYIIDSSSKKNSEEQTICAYFLCDNRDTRRNKAAHVLRGLLWQILRKRRELFELIKDDYLEQRDQLFESRDAADISCLWNILLKFLMKLKDIQVYLLVDALDELQSDPCRILLRKIWDCRHAFPNVNWFVSSRKDAHIREQLQASSSIDLDLHRDKVKIAVSRFVELKITELVPTKGYSDADLHRIRTKIGTGPEDSFLWTWFMFRELECTSAYSVEAALNSLPREVDLYYSRTLEKIDDLGAAERNIARNILLAVLLVERPVSPLELQILADLEYQGDPKTNIARIRTYVELCDSLVYDESEGRVSFVHQSAKEYLSAQLSRLDGSTDAKRPREDFLAEGHRTLAERCFRYVCVNHKELSRDTELAFHYHITFWPVHARYAGAVVTSFTKIYPEFFEIDSTARSSWLRAYSSVDEKGTCPWRTVPEKFTVLHVAAHFGISSWIGNGSAFLKFKNDQDSHGATPLYRAVHQKHLAAVQKLLYAGAKKDLATIAQEKPIYRATFNDHKEIVHLLLPKRGFFGPVKRLASVVSSQRLRGSPLYWTVWNDDMQKFTDLLDKGARGSDRESLLCRAVINGNVELVRVFLSEGEDPNDTCGEPPIYRAVYNGFEEMVRMLLKAKATPGADKRPLMAAIWRGSSDLVRLLLQNGANPDDGSEEPPIYRAVYRKEPRIVRLLLEAGAKPIGGEYPLYRATCSGEVDIVQLLLDYNARLHTVGDETPLYRACEWGSMEMADMLLQAGADVNGSAGMPLACAVRCSDHRTLKVLLNGGAIPSIRSSPTPLDSAVNNDNKELVELLLDYHASIMGGCITPLYMAVYKNDIRCVELLLNKYADPNVNTDNSPLLRAVRLGNSTLVRLLLEKGACPHAGAGESPLHRACFNENATIVSLLLENKANVNAELGTTPLSDAISLGKDEISVILREHGATLPRSTPLQLARWKGNMEIEKLLLYAGAV